MSEAIKLLRLKIVSVILIPYSLLLTVIILSYVIVGTHGKVQYLDIFDILLIIYSIGILISIYMLNLLVFKKKKYSSKTKLQKIVSYTIPFIILGTLIIAISMLIGIYNNPDINFSIINISVFIIFVILLMYVVYFLKKRDIF